ncbi:hypothetical protein, partial [uncultured Campylobacter sp.]|uniref:hypothetical protein n=1 Tax=uncultured Campylobacter sp. TaxID=218934 RepID=UPI00261EF367
AAGEVKPLPPPKQKRKVGTKGSSFASATLRLVLALSLRAASRAQFKPPPLNKKIKILKIRQNSAENLHSNLSLQNPSQKHQI